MNPKDARWKVAQQWKVAGNSVIDGLKEALDAITYMPNAVAAWREAHGGNKSLAEMNERKVRQAEDLLSEVLASLPAAVTYHVVGMDHDLKFKTKEDLIQGLARLGIKQVGETASLGGVRPELKGQPEFNKLVGPMYGGAGVVRYDTSEVAYDLSR